MNETTDSEVKLFREFYTPIYDRNARDFLKVSREKDLWEVLGFIRSLHEREQESFAWVMYILSENKGYEDIVCNFWLTHWHIINAK